MKWNNKKNEILKVTKSPNDNTEQSDSRNIKLKNINKKKSKKY